MLRVIGVGQSKAEYAQLREDVSNLNAKISQLFKNMTAAMILGGAILTVVIVGLVVTPILTTMTLAAEGFAFHSVLLKATFICSASIGIIGAILILSLSYKAYSIIKNNHIQ